MLKAHRLVYHPALDLIITVSLNSRLESDTDEEEDAVYPSHLPSTGEQPHPSKRCTLGDIRLGVDDTSTSSCLVHLPSFSQPTLIIPKGFRTCSWMLRPRLSCMCHVRSTAEVPPRRYARDLSVLGSC